MKLSVVIATYNRAALLRRLLVQLGHQTVPPEEFEVCVVDDGSTPVVMLEDLDTPYELRLARQRNAGAASARHAGVLMARGELILFLDDDMQIGKDFLARHLAAHADGTRTVVLGRIQADAALWKMPLFERWNAALLDRKADAMARGELLPRGNLLFTGNASLRREDYLAVGGFDASLPNSEDVELGLRLEKAGVQFRFCPDAPTLHGSDHTSLRKWRARAVRYGVCDQRIAKKHPELRHASPWRFVYELHRITLPFIALAVLLPRAASLLAGLSARFAELADRVGLRRIAHSGTTLAYATDYFRGVRDGAGSLRAALLELIDFAGRFEKRPFACAFLALCEDQAVMREYESRYGHAAPSEGRLAPDVVQKVGLQMMAAVRLMQGLHAAGRTTAAKIVSRVIRHLYGSDIHWEAQLEPGIMIVHGMGLAISREARVAHGCILFQHVTLGLGIDADTRKTGAPSLERDVHVGPGATLLGPITVGAGSKVMAGAVLTQPVPPGSLVETPAPQIRPRVPRVVSAA